MERSVSSNHHHRNHHDESGSPSRSAAGDDEDHDAAASVVHPGDDLPACISCRKRKLKCSRQTPSCSQCLRLAVECVYMMKQKPGMKAGAVDSLSRRLDVLEKLLLDGAGQRKPHLAFLDVDVNDLSSHPLFGSALGSIAASPGLSDGGSHRNQQEQTPPLQQSPPPPPPPPQPGASGGFDGPRKRRRTDDPPRVWDGEDDEPWVPQLPPLPLLEAIVEAHFRTVHHWIPILHETRFRAKLKDDRERAKLAVLFHALLSTVIKYVNFEEFGMTLDDVERQIRISRKAVVLNAMDSLSVENIQALIFLAFDYMGSGQSSKAWPLIGSLTRTVEYIQLTVEPDDLHKQALLRPLSLLDKPQDWTESEGRRRLFWSVFLLDRICSVTTGWNTSLTSDDVHRRLPCGGGLWAREEPVWTPYFGIWDKHTAKIGNSIAHVPTLYPSPKAMDHTSPGSSSDVDTSKLGAFAYCIEATENLSQVTSFFLQQSVDFEDRQEVKKWLTRFKELDLRLVHWKMFLPQQWQDSNVSRDVSVVKMDPNLTLAHLTHNASMILLHQHVAYPPTTWRDVVKLPSSCSAETCQLAAVETASITQRYLKYMGGIVNSQFAFCTFVAARVLFVHWRTMETNSLSPEFLSLVDSLVEISRRWRGRYRFEDEPNRRRDGFEFVRGPGKEDIAAQFAMQLLDLYSRSEDANFASSANFAEILRDASLGGFLERQTAAASTPENQSTTTGHSGRNAAASVQSGDIQHHSFSGGGYLPRDILRSPSIGTSMNRDYYPSTLPHGILAGPSRVHPPPLSYDPQRVRPEVASPNSSRLHHQIGIGGAPAVSPLAPNIAAATAGSHNRPNTVEEDELTAMSHMLLGQQFLEMDRVITLDGTDFYYDAGGRAGLMS